jgi:predicted nucleotidyltransferase
MPLEEDQLLKLLQRFQQEGVQYILVGGHAVRLNGFIRNTEDIDILLPSSIENGKRVIRALNFLQSSAELQSAWFEVSPEEPENIRVADDLLIDLLFAANGQTYSSLAPYVKTLTVDGVEIKTLDIEGLLLTKTEYRDKDRIDREALLRLLEQMKQ